MISSFITTVVCGSVDDGKSTIIGRLLVESGSVPLDHVEQARKIRRTGSLIPVGEIDYSLLTDGLESEREQGITIDVAFRQMEMPTGKRINFADSPGHEQYTRNMVVAASGADISLLIVDATRGPRPQTIRHATVCSLMGVKNLIVAINKIDLVNYSEDVFNKLIGQVTVFTSGLTFSTIQFIPVSGLVGDNISVSSPNTSWYPGKTLIDSFSSPQDVSTSSSEIFRLPIQNILRTDSSRSYAGKVSSGSLKVESIVRVIPSGVTARVSEIIGTKIDNVAQVGESVSVTVDTDIDISRGDMIVLDSDQSAVASRVYTVDLIWLQDVPWQLGKSYLLKCGPLDVPCSITDVKYVRDMDTQSQIRKSQLDINDVARVEITLARAVLLDRYSDVRETGGLILCDRLTHETVAAGMVVAAQQRESEVQKHSFAVDRSARESLAGHKACVIWFTGLPSSGKSSIADALETRLYNMAYRGFVIDGDSVRSGLSSDLGFTAADRTENVRRVGHVAELLIDAGIIAIVALVSPIKKDRDAVRELFGSSDFFEIFVDTPFEVCLARDSKGLYARNVPNMTGQNQDYEQPTNPELVIDGASDIAHNVEQVLQLIINRQKKS